MHSCCKERVHEIGAIQNLGHLLALVKDDTASSGLRIVAASANVADVPWVPVDSAAEAIGKDLGEVLDPEFVKTVQILMERHKTIVSPSVDCLAAHANRNFDEISPRINLCAEMPPLAKTTAHRLVCTAAASNSGVTLLEMEPKTNRYHIAGMDRRPTPGLLQVADVLGFVPIRAPPAVATGALCDAFMSVIDGYDRIMVYRFSSDHTGEVIHESIRKDSKVTSSYLNMRFPAMDIPQAARDLFKFNGVRFIADTCAPAVEVVGSSSVGGAKLDLSMSALRASSTMHLQYLQNMGVKASMAVAIIVDGDLWGLFAFHSYSSTVAPSIEERILVEMAATITASTIAHYEREEIAKNGLAMSRVLEALAPSNNLHDFFMCQHQPLSSILGIDSVILCEHLGHVVVYGNQEVFLTLEEVKGLTPKCVASDCVSFAALDGRGVAYFTVHSTLVAFLRGCISRTAVWAGNPDEPQVDEASMHPRASFEAYVKKGKSEFKAWSKPTLDLLTIVRHRISSQVHEEVLVELRATLEQTNASNLLCAEPAEDLQEFFAHMSHELRTPFHGVMGSLEVLETGEGVIDSEERLDVIRSALQCGKSMLGTLNDILDIAKNRHIRDVDYNPFLASSPVMLTVSAMNQFASSKSVKIQTEIRSPERLRVVGDEGRVKHIVQNLVNNAIKFTPSGGKVTISLTTADSLAEVKEWWEKESARFEMCSWTGETDKVPSDETVSWYTYCVEDTGVGVLPEDIPRLVMAYKQISHGASKSYQGTGLGLHICSLHIRAMSGALAIASTFAGEGKPGGTLFACVIPLSVGKALSGPKEDPKSPEGAFRCVSDLGTRKIKFVVVDDNKVNIRLIQRKIQLAFGDKKVDVMSAPDGLVALNVLATIRGINDDSILAGIFMDFHMPNLAGIECTRKIREMETNNEWPRVTVCGCTADATDKSRKLFEEAGADDVIGKPWGRGAVERVSQKMVIRAYEVEKEMFATRLHSDKQQWS